MIEKKLQVLLVAASFFALPSLGSGQEAVPPSSHFETLRDSAYVLLEAADSLTADVIFQQACVQAVSDDNLAGYLDLIANYGVIYRDNHQAFEKASTIFDLGSTAPLFRQPQDSMEWERMGALSISHAYALNRLGHFKEAINPYLKALEIYDDHVPEESALTSFYIYRPLGNIYTRLGDYKAAESLLNRTLNVLEREGWLEDAAETCSDMGLLYDSWGFLNKAEQYYRQGVDLAPNGSVSKALLHTNLGKLLAQQARYDEVEKEANLAIAIFQKIDPEASYYAINQYMATCFSLLANVESLRKNRTKVEAYLDSTAARIFQEYGDTPRREVAKSLVKAGNCYLNLGDLDQALKQYQRGLSQVIPDFQPHSFFDLPDSQQCYAENAIYECLEAIAIIYRRQADAEPSEALYRAILNVYDLVHDVELALRRSYLYEESKLVNLEESRQRSENTIEAARALFELSGDEDYLYRAFVYAERNRSALLREAFSANRASELAGISPELQLEESHLQETVAGAEEASFRLRSEGAADNLVLVAEQDLLRAREALSSWIQQLEANNPKYFQLKYAEEVPTLSALQQMLTPQQALIEYFVGTSSIFVFIIKDSGIILRNISKAPDLENQILVWRQAIQGYQLTGSNKDALANIYRESAYDLYQKLVAPIQEDLKNVASLLIVTSGVLDLLPFEALLTGRSEQEDFRKLPYFLADYNLSYSYSASLQFMLQAQPMSGQGLGAFAPTFKGDQGWSALSCSGSMLADILPSWNGQLWQDQEPTIEAFRREAQRFQLLHLATHAQANANEGDFSFVVFSDGQGGYDSLFTKDLYLLDLEAELVILSACETALGTLYNSEGVISLARGFHYAGARSVLTTLWSINESANCSLMEDFYQHLADGKTKAAALHSAKTDYLKAADSRSAHPVYWAGFQLLGNERPVRSGNRWWWWLLGAVLVFGSVGAWRLRK